MSVRERINATRVDDALTVLMDYNDRVHHDVERPFTEIVADLLADLMHFCADPVHKADFADCVGRAQEHFEGERA